MNLVRNVATITLLASALLACAAITLTPTVAKAAPSGFCHGYAANAVHQNSRNHIRGCGYAGWRWHAWYDGHYKWCRSTSKGFARSERVNRWLMLKQC